jgi:hypothetical protein
VFEPAEIEHGEHDCGAGTIRFALGQRHGDVRTDGARTHEIIAENEIAAVERLAKMWTIGNIQANGLRRA